MTKHHWQKSSYYSSDYYSYAEYSFHIPIEFDGKEAKILPEQIRSVDKKRIGKKIGELSEEMMIEIEEMLAILLNFHR